MNTDIIPKLRAAQKSSFQFLKLTTSGLNGHCEKVVPPLFDFKLSYMKNVIKHRSFTYLDWIFQNTHADGAHKVIVNLWRHKSCYIVAHGELIPTI